jgi:hypothetical protein
LEVSEQRKEPEVETPRHDMGRAVWAIALVVVAVLKTPRREPPGRQPRRNRQTKTRICKVHGKVVPNHKGRCPHCKGELKDS